MNLIEGIQQQQKRFREVVIPAYQEIGQAGLPALELLLKPLLERSEKAIASGDVVEAVRVYKEMQDVEL
jgi:hypothetical protein